MTFRVQNYRAKKDYHKVSTGSMVSFSFLVDVDAIKPTRLLPNELPLLQTHWAGNALTPFILDSKDSRLLKSGSHFTKIVDLKWPVMVQNGDFSID